MESNLESCYVYRPQKHYSPVYQTHGSILCEMVDSESFVDVNQIYKTLVISEYLPIIFGIL